MRSYLRQWWPAKRASWCPAGLYVAWYMIYRWLWIQCTSDSIHLKNIPVSPAAAGNPRAVCCAAFSSIDADLEIRWSEQRRVCVGHVRSMYWEWGSGSLSCCRSRRLVACYWSQSGDVPSLWPSSASEFTRQVVSVVPRLLSVRRNNVFFVSNILVAATKTSALCRLIIAYTSCYTSYTTNWPILKVYAGFMA